MAKQIKTIVLTGGPHAGKSSVKEFLKESFSHFFPDWTAVFVNESATEIMESGLKRLEWSKNYDFEYTLTKLQVQKEELYKEAATKWPNDKVVIFFDRGIPDAIAYTTEPEWNGICREFQFSKSNLMKRYDCIIHLDSALQGYGNENNKSRFETRKEAEKVNDVMWKIYEDYPQHNRVCEKETFEEKTNELVKILGNILI